MSRFLKWAYSVIFFLLMCGLVVAGSYQYKDNLSIPYNINLFNCVTTPAAAAVSCTSMTLQNSGGVEIFTASNPGNVTLTNSSVTLSGSPVSVGVGDGSDATQGAKGDTAATNGFSASSVIALLKGVLNNVITPISVTGTVNTTPSASPQNVTVANSSPTAVNIASSPVNVTVGNNVAVTPPTPLNVTVGGIVSPQNVTVGTSPVAISVNQIQGTTVSSPTTYGVAPAGSVQGVNAFITNNVNVTPPTPLQVTFPASPVSVGIAAGSSPINTTVNNSPIAVTIASSPVNITGSITANSASPTNVNLDQINGQLIASPSTYGVAPNGSVQGTNAFVTNNVNVTTPTPLQVTLPASPVSVGLSGSPVSVGVAAGSSPINVTGTFTANSSSPTTVNINQITGNQISSPTTYGVAPSGSVGGVNAFVTNSPTVVLSGSPVSVGIAAGSSPVNVTGNFTTTVVSPLGVTPFSAASPQNVTFSASPVSVAISTVSSPVNVTGTFTANSSSPTTVNLNQVTGNQISSPTTYGVAPPGSVIGVNAFVTNNVNVTPPTPLQVTLPASPISVGIAGPTPLNVTIASTPLNTTLATGVNITQIAGNNIASPTGYGTAPVGSVQGVNAFVTNTPNVNNTPQGSPQNVTIAGPTPLAVTLPSTPVLVAISTVSSPVNVTGNFTANSSSPTTVNLNQVTGNQISSPTTYGVAPAGSVLGVNAFVTNNVNVTTPTPLNVTFPASPISVGIAGPTPLNVTIASTPQNMTLATGINITQIAGNNIASPTGYGTAPVGSVQGVNAFVTNTVNATTTPSVSPQNVTIASTPLNVTIGGTPLNVTLATGTNITQIAGNNIASPTGYGTAPVGSVQGVNAFVTNNVAVTTPTPFNVVVGSPLNVTIGGPTPIAVTLPSTPVLVAISTVSSPVNVTGNFTANSSSPTTVNLNQVTGNQIASPTTYGVAPAGSVLGVNAFVTNSPTVVLSGSPVSVGIAGPTPLGVTIANSPVAINLVQAQGTNYASPSTYGVAPVGSVIGVNAFVTSLPGTPLNVTIGGPTPLNVTMSSTPLNVTLSASPAQVLVTPNPSVFLWNQGTGHNGNLASQTITLQNLELNSLASGVVTLSTLSFNNASTTTGTQGAVWGEVIFTSTSIGNGAVTCTSGANVAGWFAVTFNGATEGPTSNTVALSRAPDFVIPLATSVSLSNYSQKAVGLVRLPAMPFKIISQNNCGNTLPASGNSLYLIPIGVTH